MRNAVAAVLGATLLVAGPALAFPTKDLTYVIPFNAGGESDVTARLQEPKFRELTGKGFVIQYKTGAGGATAWSQANALPGDGHTVIGINLPHIILQPLGGNVGYKTEDLAVINVFQLTPHALIVAEDSPIKTVEDFVAEAKKRPGAVTVAGTGTNSANHVAQQVFDQAAGIKTTYVPFTGTAATTTAILGKQVTAQWGFPTVAVEQKGKLRMLAVAMDQRHAAFPNVPTFKERGIPLVDGAYRGIAVAKSTPEAERKALSDLFVKINTDPGFRKKMEEGGYVLIDVAYPDIAAFMAGKAKDYAGAAKLLGMIK